MRAKFWGVRGSLPSPVSPADTKARIKAALEGFFEGGHKSKNDIDRYMAGLPVERSGGFGGNTPSCEVITDTTSVIVDGGSGIRRKGLELLDGPCGNGKGEIHLLLTHLHWDHIMGLPFLAPIFIKGNSIHVYAVQPEAEESLRALFRKPNFPVPYDDLGAELIYHRLKPRKPSTIGDLTFTPYQLDHPDPCWGFRFEHEGRSLAYCVDTECTRVSNADLGEDLPMYQNVHTMIFDAQYTLKEAITRASWGHAAATIGLNLAMRNGIERVIFMHHDPSATDSKIAMARDQTMQYLEYELRHTKQADIDIHSVEFLFAEEEMEVVI